MEEGQENTPRVLHLTENWPLIRPVSSQEEMQELQRVMQEDNQRPVSNPTHLVAKGAELVGAARLESIALMPIWLHSQRMRPRECFSVINSLENFGRAQGVPLVVVPCDPKSPFYPVMEGMGYRPTLLFLKAL